METSTKKSRNLTEDLKVTFADEDWDYPADVPGYRGGQWLDGSEAVLIYDKYDIWQFPTSGDEPICLTEGLGRAEKYQFRIRILDRERKYLESGEKVLLTAYHDLEKHTAFAITQTNLFTCSTAGAPVSNMTSAYSGIRWGTGLARQFQYEKSQSRIGGNLWEARDKYIENSPVFFADRIETPLLIMFGDVDDAVPWYQGIELYLAMRRLGKDCVFLQYWNEPHHPKKYANKRDYTIRFKEYLDHYLR